MLYESLDTNINLISQALGTNSNPTIKKFYIGKNASLGAAIIYVNGLVDKKSIDRDILNPLMLKVNENIVKNTDTLDYLSKTYITISNTVLENNLQNVASMVFSGYVVLIIDNVPKYLLMNVSQAEKRSVEEPINETTVKGPKDGFVEDALVNISLIRKRIKDNKLSIEKFVVGKRSQSDIYLVYIDDIVNKKSLDILKERISQINTDTVWAVGTLEQYIENSTYSLFPQVYATEKPDKVCSRIVEGKIGILVSGSPFVAAVPCKFMEFFQSVEDYYSRTITGNYMRLLRIIATLISISLPSAYLALITFNTELLPVDFIVPVIKSRTGMPLSPFAELMVVEGFVEFLREGGLRLPTKVASTLSIVGGIIIGNSAIDAKIVSPTTLLIVGISAVASFLVPNYDMSYSLRLYKYIMIILSSFLGILGLSASFFFLIVHLSSLESFGEPYMTFYKNDLKDTFIREPRWQLNTRPQNVAGNNFHRLTNFRKLFRRK